MAPRPPRPSVPSGGSVATLQQELHRPMSRRPFIVYVPTLSQNIHTLVRHPISTRRSQRLFVTSRSARQRGPSVRVSIS